MIHVLAIINAKPGMRASILEAYRGNVANVRAEAGCLAYEAVVDVPRWESVEALRAHAVAPHMKAYAAKVEPFTASRSIHVLQAA